MGRPIHHPELGRFFSDFKRTKSKGWSAEAHLALQKKLPLLTRQVLLRLAKGATKWPDPDVLREFAAFYEVSYEMLVAEVVRHAYSVRMTPATIDSGSLLAAERELADERARRLAAEKALAPWLKAQAESDGLAERRKPPDAKPAKGRSTG